MSRSYRLAVRVGLLMTPPSARTVPGAVTVADIIRYEAGFWMVTVSPTPPSLMARPVAVTSTPGALNVIRSEEHTSELQSHVNLVCRLLLEKKKKRNRMLLGRTTNYWDLMLMDAEENGTTSRYDQQGWQTLAPQHTHHSLPGKTSPVIGNCE